MELKRFSKFMSLVLRHNPELIGAQLQPGGWLPIQTLCDGAIDRGLPLTTDVLREVVSTNEKQRFDIDASGTLVRANQGHSVPVDLGLEPCKPPDQLYHGTAECFVKSIRNVGLISKARNHVHLSLEYSTAVNVGKRHGTPIVLVVDAGAMHSDGHQFYLSKNGVWLTKNVLPQYINFNI